VSGLEAGLLLGGVHGVVLAMALWHRTRNRAANRYLAVLLAAMSLLLFDGYLRASGQLAAHPHLIGLTAWVPFVLGPLVFLYVREMTAPDPERQPPMWHHLVVPAIYVVVLVTTFYPRSAAYKLNVAKYNASWIILATEIALLVYGNAYAIAALLRLRRHRHHVQALFSNLHGVSLRWLSVLASLNAIVWIAALVAFVIRVTGVIEGSAASVIVPVGSAITVFVLGYFQLGQGEIYAGQPASVLAEPTPSPVPSSPPETPPTPEPVATEPPSDPKPSPTYQRARLPEEDAAALVARITAAMTESRLYQRAGLTLAELADEVAATPHELSQVLSTRFGRNFYTFVNEHRIEHVKTGLRTTDRPVLDLALEAGFSSKSTFNSAFRKATGTTPREFRQRPTS
jgi:AraC-like DNA-binding protein